MHGMIGTKPNGFISMHTAQHRASHACTAHVMGVRSIYALDMTKLIVGAAMVCIGIVTLPLPTGSVVLIGLGVPMCIDSIPQVKYSTQKIKKRLKHGGFKKFH